MSRSPEFWVIPRVNPTVQAWPAYRPNQMLNESFSAGSGGGDATLTQPGATSASVLDHVSYVIDLVRPLVDAVTPHDRDLASQLRRALGHVALNVADGFGTGAPRRERYESAGSALSEARAVLRVAAAWGYVSAAEAHAALEPIQALDARVAGLSRG